MTPEQLKASILQYAMEGKLVKQDPNDEPASELLKKIKAEKAKFIKENKIKKNKKLPEITQEELPFKIPKNWEWVRLQDIGSWGSGATPSRQNFEYYENGSIPWLKTGDLNDGIIDKTSEKITEKALKETSVKVNKPGNLLVAMYGATIGKLGIVGEELTTNQACCGCDIFTGTYNWFLFYYLLFSRKALIKMGAGGAQPNISKTKIEKFIFPLPPFNEQKRIVIKIEQLIPLVDRYAESYNRLKEIDDAFNDKMKQSILQYAMEGKLVKQDPNDEPASGLLKKIKVEKTQLIKGKKIKATKKFPEITQEEKPFKIPNNWEWVRLGNMASILNGDRGKNYPGKKYWIDSGIPFINAGALGNKYVNKRRLNYISEERYHLLRSGFIEPNDIIYCLRGSLGKVSINKDLKSGAIASSVAIIRLYIKDSVDYIFNLLASSFGDYLVQTFRNGTAQPNIAAQNILLYPVPLPPFNEQKRIVTKIDSLFQKL